MGGREEGEGLMEGREGVGGREGGGVDTHVYLLPLLPCCDQRERGRHQGPRLLVLLAR